MSHHAYFVTGTDTDVGKTRIACALLHLARARGLSTAAGKPLASGAERYAEGLRNDDAMALAAECRPSLPYVMVNPFTFAPAIAPHIAAREAGAALSLPAVAAPMRELLAQRADFSLIEGAGGWRVPIDDRHTLANLAQTLDLDVILVVGVRLGALNHARLSFEAIEADGLRVAGWVANLVDPGMACAPQASRLDANLASLAHWLPAPCLGVVPHLDAPTPAAVAAHLTLTPLIEASPRRAE